MGDEAADPAAPGQGLRRWSRPRVSPISPRLSLLLIGGVAIGGLACMCLAVAALAIWRAT